MAAMGVVQWARLTLDRLGSKMREAMQPDEDELLFDEEDPIGEFLSRRKRGAILPKDEEAIEDEGVGIESAEAVDQGKGAESAAPVVVKLDDDADEPQAAVEASPEDESETVLSVESPEGEAGDDEVQRARPSPPEDGVVLVEGVGEEPPDDGETDVSEAEAPITVRMHEEHAPGEEEGEVDSLLDVFKEVQWSDSQISLLSRDLGDTNVYSLLEEMRWIAKKVKDASTESGR